MQNYMSCLGINVFHLGINVVFFVSSAKNFFIIIIFFFFLDILGKFINKYLYCHYFIPWV